VGSRQGEAFEQSSIAFPGEMALTAATGRRYQMRRTVEIPDKMKRFGLVTAATVITLNIVSSEIFCIAAQSV